MLLKEFEELTGIYPSSRMWEVIHEVYMEDETVTKQVFCKKFKENKDGLQERIRNRMNNNVLSDWATVTVTINSLYKTIQDKDNKINYLEEKLYTEEEWRPYEIKENVSQAQYENLLNDSDVEQLNENKACRLLSDWFGFYASEIEIIHELPTYEINRHHCYKKVGTVKRDPLYFSTDMNYICFRCKRMEYELYNGTLSFLYS